MIVTRATPADLEVLLHFREEASGWLRALGIDQWSKPYPPELMLASIAADNVFLFSEKGRTVATVTLDQEDLEPGAWTEDELQEPALYVHKLTVFREASGRNLGGRILDWAGDRAARSGAQWLRLDAWTSNPMLQDYYLRQGFRHVRTVTEGSAVNGGARVSGWLAQRPAVRTAHGLDDRSGAA
ncbi:GNAT family N-acetyltransferase [Streptomyces sp. H39-S7]|uniref:GNAT family N-acetyltransferase n=1 Tax=Streptomyces sp. H39-S7 TaxID=3004357 RepID=UPI0022B003F2|nr:GNAT family N-acetyltransferase [Streptomyces sp. H39-S7]MCZ4125292.1 GNAT family N-acetyltransferase [Streptomyces sp. H39-S7]